MRKSIEVIASEWFDNLSTKAQKEYLSEHPDSKFAHKLGKNISKNPSVVKDKKKIKDHLRQEGIDTDKDYFQHKPSDVNKLHTVHKLSGRKPSSTGKSRGRAMHDILQTASVDLTTKEGIEAAYEEANEYFNKEAKKILPDFYFTKAVSRQVIGSLSVTLLIAKENTPVTWRNNRVAIEFFVEGLNSKGLNPKQKFEIEMHSRTYALKEAGLKFRKISAATPLDSYKKLLKWLTANKNLIENA